MYLPSATLRGLAGEWLNPASGLALQAGSGEPGQLESVPASGFRGLGGRRTTLGAQWHLGASPDSTDPLGLPGWTLALQHEDASRVTALGQTRETGAPLDARSTLFALRHEGDSRRTQGQLILSRGDTPATSAGGNFTVALDLDGDNTGDSNTPAGIPGVRVGALASRYDVRNPIPDVDFCRGNRTLNWVQSSNSCSTVIFNDTPVGYRFVAVDADTGGGAGAGGSAFIRCVYNPNANPPAQLSILSSCCQNGNQACTPPAVP